MEKGINLQTLKASNRASVLYLLNANGGMSRKAIAAKLGLTPAALTKITAKLLEEKVIVEKETYGSGVGRKEVVLALNFDNKRALGVTFERDNIYLSVASLDGKLDSLESIPFTSDFKKVKSTISEYYQRVRKQYNLVGVGVSIIGQDTEYGMWPNISIKNEIESIIDIPVFVRNNVRAFATATMLYGDSQLNENVLVFKWGPGIGSSFIREGKVLSGDDDGVTEIGHIIVNPNGKKCRCGRRGCLETETALDVIKEELLCKSDNSIDDVLNSNDPHIVKYLSDKISMVCLALMNASTILNANQIVVFGSVFLNDSFTKRFLSKWNEYNPIANKTIQVSSLIDKSSYIGSTAMVARKIFFEKGM